MNQYREERDKLKAENARLRDVVESYVASGPTNQELRDLYIEEHNENARLRESMAAYDRLLREAEAERDRLREDRDLGKRMYDDLELERDDLLAALREIAEYNKLTLDSEGIRPPTFTMRDIARAAIAKVEGVDPPGGG